MVEGALPMFEIEGTGFYVDLAAEEFCQVDAPGNRISFDFLGVHKYGYVLRYDIMAKNVWTGPKGEEPAHVRIVFVPFKSKLDPIGYARQLGYPDDYFTR
jgi:hypothetical protein